LELNWDLRQEQLKETDGSRIPYEDNFFDKVVCYGVFDACNQEQILGELLRVAKVGGTIFLTGKNYNYYDDDDAAFVAEVNARKKGHPNSFTDVNLMIKELEEQGMDILAAYFFLRRGDVQRDCYVTERREEPFYEWQIIIRKNVDSGGMFKRFSDKFSETFRRKERA
jgi:hypothetical protein